MHERGRHHVVDHRGHEQEEEREEIHDPFLPNHQRRDVAEGTEGPARVGCHHDIDAGQTDEPGIVRADRQDHGAHQQGRRQVIRHRRNEERQDAREPKQLAIGKPLAHQPRPQAFEDQPFFHGIDVRHGGQQK